MQGGSLTHPAQDELTRTGRWTPVSGPAPGGGRRSRAPTERRRPAGCAASAGRSAGRVGCERRRDRRPGPSRGAGRGRVLGAHVERARRGELKQHPAGCVQRRCAAGGARQLPGRAVRPQRPQILRRRSSPGYWAASAQVIASRYRPTSTAGRRPLGSARPGTHAARDLEQQPGLAQRPLAAGRQADDAGARRAHGRGPKHPFRGSGRASGGRSWGA